jgi:hypothetical protein
MFQHPENAGEAMMSAITEEAIEPWPCVDVGWDRSRWEERDWLNIWTSWDRLLECIEECRDVYDEDRILYWDIIATSIRQWQADPLIGFPLLLLKGKLPRFGPVLDRFLAAAAGHSLKGLRDCIETIQYVFEQFTPGPTSLTGSTVASYMQYLYDYRRKGSYRIILMVPGQQNAEVLANIVETLWRQYYHEKQAYVRELADLRVTIEHVRLTCFRVLLHLLSPGPSPPFVSFLTIRLPKLLTSCGAEDPL